MKTMSLIRSGSTAFTLITVALALVPDAPAQIHTGNLPPTVSILQPPEGAVFPGPANIFLVADARDRDGYVASVEFFAGTYSLGFGVNRVATSLSTNLFVLVWSNVPPGSYPLTAKATDNLGATAVSAPPVDITVWPGPPPLPPVVTIRATDPYASEPCGALTVIDPGKFTIYRNRGTNIDLLVRYTVAGTASNGLDYVAISNAVVIPKGAWSADVLINPRWDGLSEGTETVALRLEPVFCVAIWPPPPGCSLVGQPAEALVFIRDCIPSNVPPLVRIVEPPSRARFRAPATIKILADTVDPDGYVGGVEFFEGTRKIGQQIKMFLVAPTNGTHIPYDMTWSNVPPGAYVLTARGTDSRGTVGVSPPVPITVLTNAPPPITNRPPIVTIIATDPLAIEGTNCWGWPSVTNRWPLGTTNFVTIQPNSPIPIWWFTNCGPKHATLTVRRAGDTNDELTVSYDIGGTATNGVDYDPLPGFVTIPAGERKADIAIVPREDHHPDPLKTVMLKLASPPATSDALPPYIVGYPNRAGAVIVDSDRPYPLRRAFVLPDRCFLTGSEAVDGAWYRIECSTDLINWAPVCTNQAVQGAIQFVDPEAQNLPERFYRTVPEAGPPPP